MATPSLEDVAREAAKRIRRFVRAKRSGERGNYRGESASDYIERVLPDADQAQQVRVLTRAYRIYERG